MALRICKLVIVFAACTAVLGKTLFDERRDKYFDRFTE